MPLTLAVRAGTTREKRESFKASYCIANLAGQREEVEAIVVDPKDFNLLGSLKQGCQRLQSA